MMGESIDYIVYMTYDLHGQWDYGNEWTSPDCPTGNCLRSHVNENETKDALAMITKAGVPSGKVVVGVSSYGRSFKMATAGCDGPDCLFTGTNEVSNAAKGRCTATGGYISNAEIAEIIDSDRVTKQWKAAGSNILVYDSTEWVAYMDEDLKSTRAAFYGSYNFAGTTDWAVDLQKFWEGTGDGGGGDDDGESSGDYVDEDFPPCTGTYSTFDLLKKARHKIHRHCLNKYILDVEIAVIERALKKYKDLVDGDYDEKFGIYESYVKQQVPIQINRFVGENGDKYFQCRETKKRDCCDECTYITCHEDCSDSSSCTDGLSTEDIDCPTNLSDGDIEFGADIPNATYVMRDEDGFFEDILQEYGIEKDWIKFARKRIRHATGCQYAEDINECIEEKSFYWYNYPIDDNVQVSDPKDLIGEGYEESKSLLARLKAFQAEDFDEVDMWIDGVTWFDMADAASMPAFVMEQAIASMEKVIETAEEINEAQRVAFILNFIGSLLFFIPVIGSSISGASMATVRAILSLVGTVGEVGLLVYGIVEDPDSAFMAIFGALAGAAIGRGGFREAAVARRDMPASELRALGPIKDKLHVIASLRGSSCSSRDESGYISYRC
jgi:Glycosyl hydrolases family 18